MCSQRKLARLADRDIRAVKRDLEPLFEANLVDTKSNVQTNHLVLPHDTIIVEPILSKSVADDASYTIENEP